MWHKGATTIVHEGLHRWSWTSFPPPPMPPPPLASLSKLAEKMVRE